MNDFGDYVRRTRVQKGMSMEDVSRRSARFGKPISSAHVSRIENNPMQTVTIPRLQALAHGLGVPVTELLMRAIGALSPAESEELFLLTRFRELSPNRQSAVIEIVDMFYSKHSKQKSQITDEKK